MLPRQMPFPKNWTKYGIDEKDLSEAKYNLFGFFSVLYKIDQRLQAEKNQKKLHGL